MSQSTMIIDFNLDGLTDIATIIQACETEMKLDACSGCTWLLSE